MSRIRQPHKRVIGRFVKIPEPLADGRVRCPACSAAVSVNKNGTLRRHKMPAGDQCMQRAVNPGFRLTEVPPVRIPPKAVPPEKRPSRLDAGSACEDCGRWLPGERRLCGRCTVRRAAS